MSVPASNTIVPAPATSVSTEKVDVVHHDVEHEQDTGKAAIVPVSPWQSLSAIETVKTFRKASILCFLCGFNACSDGYQLSMPGNVIAMPGFIDLFGIPFGANGAKALKATDISNWAAVYTAAYIAILILGSFPADLLGRKACLFLIQFFLAIACILEMFAQTSGMWMGAKALAGLSVGLNQCVLSAYVSELAPTKARGALLAAYQLWFAMGQLGAAIGVKIVNTNYPPDKWRHCIYSCWVFTGIALIIWVFLPESPRWLATKGKDERAKAVLRRVNGGVQGYDVDLEYSILLQEIEDGKALTAQMKNVSVLSIFRGTNLRRTLISFSVFGWQQWVGVPVIFGYTAYFFQLAGLKDPFMGTIAVFLILLVFVAISFYSIERFGRRILLINGGIVMLSCLLIVGGVGTITGQTGVTGSVVIAFSCIWVAAYALTAGPIGYVLLAETSTVLLRAKTTSIAAAMTGCLNLVVNYCTPLMLAPTGANWGVKGVAFFYFGTGLIGFVLIYFFVPETKGRSYIELDELFERRIPARQFRLTKTSAQEISEVANKDELA